MKVKLLKKTKIESIRHRKAFVFQITNKKTKKITHTWRSEEMAIAVGTNTVKIDNPCLTVREVFGKNPVRIIIDEKLQIDKNYNVFDKSSPTLVFNSLKSETNEHIEFIKADFDELIPVFLHELYKRNLMSVIIEGGAAFLNSFIQRGLWDEARIITGENEFENGIAAPRIMGAMGNSMKKEGDEIQMIFRASFNKKDL